MSTDDRELRVGSAEGDGDDRVSAAAVVRAGATVAGRGDYAGVVDIDPRSGLELERGPRPLLCAPEDWIAAAPGPWWVLHTRARNEKRVAELLDEKGVWYYLPLRSVYRTYAKRWVVFHVPLFPGYLFLSGDHDACDAARRTNRVAQVIHVKDQVLLRRELTQVYRAVEGGGEVLPFPRLRAGQRCRVLDGPFKDLEGVVVRNGPRWRMYISVTILSQSVIVELDTAALEPID